MAARIFPEEILDNSQEDNFSRHSVRTRIIYAVVLLSLSAAILVIPFIEVDVSVRSNGVIKPVVERNRLKPLVSGKIEKIHIRENELIKRGEKAIELASPRIDRKLKYNRKRQKKVKGYLYDLNVLQHLDSASVLGSPGLHTSKYRRSFLEFKQQVYNHLQQIRKAKQKLVRDAQLFERNALSKTSYDQSVYNLKSRKNTFKLLLKQQLHDWLQEKVSYTEEFEKLRAAEERTISEKKQHILRAPVSGTIHNMQGLYKGSLVSPNQQLAVISPDTSLIAECYVPPADIGLLREGMKTRINVSAYNFRQWGILRGKVLDISDDVTVINDRPVFTVRSTLSRPFLELDNGYRGELKKGMTIQARFVVTRRSLFQLLYDNVEDWVNPRWDNN